MKCPGCGRALAPTKTDVPFPVSNQQTVIVMGTPVLQCRKCREFVIEEKTMARVDLLLESVSSSARVVMVEFVE